MRKQLFNKQNREKRECLKIEDSEVAEEERLYLQSALEEVGWTCEHGAQGAAEPTTKPKPNRSHCRQAEVSATTSGRRAARHYRCAA